MIPWLERDDPFPAVERALPTPNGLLAASADLTADRLLDAYGRGIFPWYGDDEPVLWWSPDPRMVLFTGEFKIARSLRKTIRKVVRCAAVEVRIDTAFDAVIRACAAPRPKQNGTWITPAVIQAYGELHRRGLAHSVEVWRGQTLLGGLYGVCLGRMFYGESMFSRATDASKIALAALVRLLQLEEVRVIDCQQNTRHLASFGAREIARRDFCSIVRAEAARDPVPWAKYTRVNRSDLLSDY
jgi:leucyl/phenylalanyl-tRNA--protein transferase